MNQRRQEFARHYALLGNASEAARKAGYAPGSAWVTGSRLLRDATVLRAVRSHQSEHEAELQLSRERVLWEMMEAVEVAKSKQDAASMIAGWREIGRICGYYAEQLPQNSEFRRPPRRLVGDLERLPDAELAKLVADGGTV